MRGVMVDRFEEAIDCITKGRYEEAKEIFEEILADDPENVIVLYNLGMCFTDLGHPNKAIKALEQCIKYSPDYSNAYVALGVAYSKLDDLQSAKKYFLEALNRDANNSFALRNLGGLFGNSGEMEKSLYYLEKAYEIDPVDPKTVYGLGYSYQAIKDYEKADKYYKEVLSLGAPAEITDLAKDGRREIAVSNFKAKGLRMDAVFYLLSALNLFERKKENEIRDITFEIGLKGRGGLDINNPDKKYSLNTLEGQFTGLQLVCYMYVGFNKIDPSLNIGMDLSDEYAMALKLFNSEDVQ